MTASKGRGIAGFFPGQAGADYALKEEAHLLS